MTKTMKCVVCLCLVLLTLCGCTMPWSKEEAPALTVSGAEIGADLYAYYLTLVLRTPEAYGVAADDEDAVREQAIRLCVDYAAVGSAFANEGLRLSPEYKMQIAENVSTKWSFYKKYYQSVGIEKQTVTKYETNEAKRKALIEHKYGEGGAQAVSKIELDAYYAVNYVTFRSINGYLTRSGTGERLSEAEIREAEKCFTEMCERVLAGSSPDDVCKDYADRPFMASTEAETVTINRKINNYPSEFFASVQKMDEGAARVIETNDYIFLVVKQSAESDENLQSHKLSCLLEMCAEPFAAYLKPITDGYSVHKDSVALREVYNAVEKKFS